MYLAITIAVLCCFTFVSSELEVVHHWNLLSYDLPYDYPVDGGYVPENNVFTGIEIGWNRIFLAIPRLRAGVPATLTWIPKSRNGGPLTSPTLNAYPNWSFHSSTGYGVNCSGLISVYRIRADRCNRLWVLDSGVSTSLDDFTTVCPPKLLVFDLTNDQLVKSITFPRGLLRPNSLLTNLVLDEAGYGSCDDAYVYISDTAAPGLVVYDARKDVAWRFTHPAMWPDPDYATYNIAGESFTLPDGIIGLALSPPSATASRILYFQPLASDRVFAVTTQALQAGPSDDLPVQLVGRKSSQGAGLAVEPSDGSIYFSPVTETAVASWQPGTNKNKVLAYNPELLQFAADLRIAYRDGGTLWLITTRFQKYFRRTLNPREVNFRILRIVNSNPLTTNLLTLRK